MTTRRSGRRDPLETAIEITLEPGRFIAYRAGSDFVSSLEEVAGQLEALVRTDARRAVRLYETFLAGCYEKAEELDDSRQFRDVRREPLRRLDQGPPGSER